jgi:hypothetical protein
MLTSPCNYNSQRETTPVNKPHPTLIYDSEAKEPPLREPVVLERVQREELGVVLERVQREQPGVVLERVQRE